ncbi:MAG: hypothetical protein WA208_14610 [Thermoanaerobaculia bacterium]
MKKYVLAIAIAAAGVAVGVEAQLTSDQVPRQRLVPRAEQIRQELEAARYRLGPFRIQPRLLFRDLGYNDNVYASSEGDPVSDWTATVAGGIHWTLPFGPKGYIRGDALPEYSWYKDLADRRFFGGTYNASAVALFNRMQLEGTVGTSKRIGYVSSELEAPAILGTNDVGLDAEVDILPSRLSLFAAGQTRGLDYDAGDVAGSDELARIDELDRDDSLVRAGLRYRLTSFFDVSVAGEQTRSEFDTDALRRDNESQAAIVGIHYDRPKFYVNLSAGQREGTALNGSSFREYSATTGSYFAQYEFSAPLTAEVYGHQRVTYGLFADTPYFFEDRNGLALTARIGQRLALRAFGDVGQNDYDVAVSPGRGQPAVVRVDDVKTFGGTASFRVYRNMALAVTVSQSDYTSNLAEYDRSIVRVQTGLVISGDSFR